MPDLSLLNSAERTVLTLLAQGHTAKSIATATGRSESAVNERLREARRKTGVGSSRELARLLMAQENRDKQVGVVPAAEPAPAPVRAPLRVRWIGALAMTVIVALAAAALLLQPVQERPLPGPTSIGTDPFFAELAGPTGPAWPLHARLMAETRDADWATRIEAALIDRYGAAPWVDKGVLVVTCGATLCEVLGRSNAALSPAEVNRAASGLQSTDLRTDLAKLGLAEDAVSLNLGPSAAAPRFGFVAYWRRVPG